MPQTPPKTIQVLGAGCRKCRVTADAIQATADRLGVPIVLEKVEDYAQIAAFGVMGTPSVVVDGEVVLTGRVPKPATIEGWLA